MNINGTLMNDMICSKLTDIPLSGQTLSLVSKLFVYLFVQEQA